jgi:hypothetical protein
LPGSKRATPATTDDNLLGFCVPAVERKKITAAFDGGRAAGSVPMAGGCCSPEPIVGSASPIGWLG